MQQAQTQLVEGGHTHADSARCLHALSHLHARLRMCTRQHATVVAPTAVTTTTTVTTTPTHSRALAPRVMERHNTRHG
jgi:hypothetical protein